jgi:autotransporter-associated beta strand protein
MLEGSETWDPTTDTPYYGFWRNVSSNLAPGNFQITYSDTNRSLGRDTKLWMTADPNTYNVYIGTTPVPARGNTVPTNFFNSLGLVRPSAIIRHRISSGTLQDLFVSVVEPTSAGNTNIVSVQRLPMSGTTNESVGLKITFKDGRVDTYIVNLRNPQVAGATGGSATVSTLDGQYSLTGRIGLHVDRPTSDPRVITMDATDFKYAGRELSTPTNTYFSGLIAGETRKLDGASNDAFTTTSPLPVGTALRNKWLSFTHGALSGSGTTGISEMFLIDQVLFSNNQYYICFTNDHELEITNGTTSAEQVAPLRTFTTSNSFEIALSASAQQISPLADIDIPPGGSSGPISFTFGNLGSTAGSSLQIITNSSNETIVPENLITIGGGGTNRTINVAATAGQTGSALITISVTDGVWTNSRSFMVFVNDFVLNASPPSQAVTVGGGTSYTASVAATNGFNGLVTFDVAGVPTNASASFSPPTITGTGSVTLNVTASNTVVPGTYPLTLMATSGSLSSTSSVTLVVNPVVTAPGWANWSGGNPAGANWGASANWAGVALVPGDSLAFNGSQLLNNTNDIAAGTIYSNIVFNPGAGSFVLNGNPITLAGGITNNSSNPQTVALGLDFSNSITLDGASNLLVIAGGLTNESGAPGTTTVTLAGNGEIKNLLKSTISPGGTNLMLLNSATANWTLLDNDTSAAMSVPWAFAVNSGSFTFGGAAEAPMLSSTTPNGVPQDNQVGTVSGATGAFNLVNGTFTTSGRLNTATAVNSTGLINQVGGTMNIGNQFQGANGSSAGEVSVVNVSGGTMNIGSAANATSPFYVASRGTGTLTVSGAGVVSCGKLDISRNAAGNTISSSGTVNLDGGSLMVASVTNISANQQTGGSPTATFNFNGGRLVAKSGASAMFFQGSTATPITPIQTFVKAGGAIIDDGGNAITIGEPLKHDPALGSGLDGGLTKTNAGRLILIGTNTYTGDTTISAGALALAVNGSISNSRTLNVGAGAILDASSRSDGRLTVAAGQTLAGNGGLNGNVTLAAGAILAPGVLTFSNSLTLNAGSTTAMDVSKAPLTNNAVHVTGLLTYGGTLSLNFTDALDATDSFKLFAAGSYSGVFANILPATAGAGLAWNTNTLAADGTLRIVVVPPPVIAGVVFSGGNIVMSGSNGSPGTNYYVLASTNLFLPFSNWERVGTDAFDQNGNFQFTNNLNGSPQRYYILQLP